MRQYDVVTARFSPKRTDDLVPAAELHRGEVHQFQACWIIEAGQFKGQWAMVTLGPWRDFPIGHVPFEDLTEVEMSQTIHQNADAESSATMLGRGDRPPLTSPRGESGLGAIDPLLSYPVQNDD